MATNILLLPFVTFAAQTDTNGDWLDQIAFLNNGAPLDITGIAFRLAWRSAEKPASSVRPLQASTSAGTMINNGTTGVLGMAVPVATMGQVAPDSYLADLIASADGHTINLSAAGLSTITHTQGVS